MALAPEPCRPLRVSAVAVPEGNGNWSMLINCRFSGTAMHSPREARQTSQAIICHVPIGRPVQR